MRAAMTAVTLSVTLLCSACGLPQVGVHAGGIGAWSDPGLARWRTPGYKQGFAWRPALACDDFGRCWRRGPEDGWPGYGLGHKTRAGPQAPRWAGDPPDHARAPDRFLRPRSGVICDRTTQLCYQDRKIDRNSTEDVFGERAGNRARDLRDALGTARLFVPGRGVACDRERRVCLEDGVPNRGATRRYFGPQATDALTPDRPRERSPERVGQTDDRRPKQSLGPANKKKKKKRKTPAA